jgi:hypothetical protein
MPKRPPAKKSIKIIAVKKSVAKTTGTRYRTNDSMGFVGVQESKAPYAPGTGGTGLKAKAGRTKS